MKTALDLWAEDLVALASLTFALTQPGVSAEYEQVHGPASALTDLGTALNTVLCLLAAKARSEVTEEDHARVAKISAWGEPHATMAGGRPNE